MKNITILLVSLGVVSFLIGCGSAQESVSGNEGSERIQSKHSAEQVETETPQEVNQVALIDIGSSSSEGDDVGRGGVKTSNPTVNDDLVDYLNFAGSESVIVVASTQQGGFIPNFTAAKNAGVNVSAINNFDSLASLDENQVDRVVGIDVISQVLSVINSESFFSDLKRVLKKNGIIYIGVSGLSKESIVDNSDSYQDYQSQIISAFIEHGFLFLEHSPVLNEPFDVSRRNESDSKIHPFLLKFTKMVDSERI